MSYFYNEKPNITNGYLIKVYNEKEYQFLQNLIKKVRK